MTRQPAPVVPDPLWSCLIRVFQSIKSGGSSANILILGANRDTLSFSKIIEAWKTHAPGIRLYYLEADPEIFQKALELAAAFPEVVVVNQGTAEVEPELGRDWTDWAAEQSGPVDQQLWKDRLASERALHLERGVPTGGVRYLKDRYQITAFDLVILNGSPFSGRSDLREVYGAQHLLLVDAIGPGNLPNVKRLMNEPGYRLLEGIVDPEVGYAYFERAATDLPLELFTIVLNGRQFLPRQLEVFRQLQVPWRWHIIEGVARQVHDTAWSVRNGGGIDDSFHDQGRSIDGTSEWLDQMARQFPGQILLYRQPRGLFWEGKLAMVRAPLENLHRECVLWQVDVDEFWTAAQIERAYGLFTGDARRSSAYYFCDFHVGPELVSITPHTYGNNLHQDWLRTWRFRPGMQWVAHEPPTLVESLPDGQLVDLGQNFPFTHYETAREGLIFQHLAYVQTEQLAFKEKYYGYRGAVEAWKRLQEAVEFPVRLRDFFPWADQRTLVHRSAEQSLSRYFQEQRAGASELGRIVIDGVFYQMSAESGIARVWTCLLQQWSGTDFGRRLVVLDRDFSAPRVDGITYLPLQAHQYGNLAQDQRRIEAVCRFHEAPLFISTYYSRPLSTPSLMMAYDFIPEIFLRETVESDPMWAEKVQAVRQAAAFLCISENTRQDLGSLYPETRLKPVRYTHLASDYQRKSSAEQAEFRWKHKLHRPFWLLVGARRSYKNADLFFSALRQFSSRSGFDVVCTGARDLEPLEGPDINLRKLRLDDHDLQCAYSSAEALIYPSLYEGFGLPILEAMSCGCPVITCKISSMPEVAGEAALYVHPRKPEELAEAMSRVQLNAVRSSLIEAGYGQAAKFTWATTARQTQQFILDVIQSQEKSVGPSAQGEPPPEPLRRGLESLDHLLHHDPRNLRVAENLLVRLEKDYPGVPRLGYFREVLARLRANGQHVANPIGAD